MRAVTLGRKGGQDAAKVMNSVCSFLSAGVAVGAYHFCEAALLVVISSLVLGLMLLIKRGKDEDGEKG